MNVMPVNPVSRSDRASAVRRESHSNQRQRFAPQHLADDDPETEPMTEIGMAASEDDSYALADDRESAILKEIRAETLRSPASIATRLLQESETNDGYHR